MILPKRILRHVFVAEIVNAKLVVHEIGVVAARRTTLVLTKRVSSLGFAQRVPARSVHDTPNAALQALLKKLSDQIAEHGKAVAELECARQLAVQALAASTG